MIAKASHWVVGLALFSMFFGSGNLIYPLYIGQLAGADWFSSALGFLLTGVLVPFLGVLVMVLYRGNKEKFFALLGSKATFLFVALLLTVWIPLGSGPRCITVAASSLSNHSMPLPFWLFSLLYSLLVWFIVVRKSVILDFLGKFLTPLLLGCLSIIFVQSLDIDFNESASLISSKELFWTGLIEGYNTMDLIASFFFSASVIHMLGDQFGKECHPLRLMLRSGTIGVVILGSVYLGMISTAAHFSSLIEGVPRDRMLATIAYQVLGPNGSIVPIIAICLACFSTSVALSFVYSEFLEPWAGRAALPLTLISSFLMSLTGLEGITYVTSPALKILYPILIVLIVIQFARFFMARKEDSSRS